MVKLVDGKNFNKKLQEIQVELITLKNKNGMTMQITNYGGRIVSLFVPNKHGQWNDVLLGYDNIDAYPEDPYYMGALVGRYANRIDGGRFSLFGKEYQLTQNAGNNHLHGGFSGLHAKVWIPEKMADNELRLSVSSPHGEDGYPGSVSIEVRYRIRDDNALHISFLARTDQATIINLTSHPYFNLSGDFSKPVLNHLLQLEADQFTPVNQDLVPTGEIVAVQDTVFDFRTFKPIGRKIENDDPQLKLAGGYDHNFILLKQEHRISKAATVIEKENGIKMEMFTSEPGLQFYSGNFLKETDGKFGQKFDYRTGFCLEAQHFPDSPNHPHFPMTILMPDQIYRQDTIFKFTVVS